VICHKLAEQHCRPQPLSAVLMLGGLGMNVLALLGADTPFPKAPSHGADLVEPLRQRLVGLSRASSTEDCHQLAHHQSSAAIPTVGSI
jgi:hypothetical protein